jgi:undecaprenyl diphosphate synthase
VFSSTTNAVPETRSVPRHVAVIMDGNGRWARKRFLPRVAGHRRGLETVRSTVSSCAELGVEYLTLFAFSSENWRRPKDEVSFLMELFVHALEQEVAKLHSNNIRLKVVGDRTGLDKRLIELISGGEEETAANTGLTLTIAANYGGRWDVLQAVNRLARDNPDKSGNYTEQDLQQHLAMSYAPEPDLFIRTGGEQRISNFLLWQLAYTEMYFTDQLWPDFDSDALATAFAFYRSRERRFGRTSEQVSVPVAQGAPETPLR